MPFLSSLPAVLLIGLMLSGCAPTLATSELNRAAAAIVSGLEASLNHQAAMPVVALGFVDHAHGRPSGLTTRLENRLNHFISTHPRFTLVTLDVAEIDRLAELLHRQFRPEFSDETWPAFTAVGHIITGSITREGRHLEIQAMLKDLQTAETPASVIVTARLEAAAIWKVGLAAVLLAGLTGLILMLRGRRHHVAATVSAAKFEPLDCAACGGRISNQYQQGGQCRTPGCSHTICTACWNERRVMTCRECQAEAA